MRPGKRWLVLFAGMSTCAFVKIDSWMVPGSSEGFTAVFVSLLLTVKWLKCRISVGRAFNYSQMLPVAFDVLVGGQSYD